MHYWFGNYKLKKQRNNAGKSADINKKFIQNNYACAIIQFAIKSTSISCNELANLAKDDHQQKNTENSKIFKNKKLANRFLKIKNSTNQIRDVFLLVKMGDRTHCQTALCSQYSWECNIKYFYKRPEKMNFSISKYYYLYVSEFFF